MKTYEINLDDFEADVVASMEFDTSTIEDATLAGIVEQIRQQIEPEKKKKKTKKPFDKIKKPCYSLPVNKIRKKEKT